MAVTVNFVGRTNGPERLVAEAEIVFDQTTDNPLAGLKLVGFSLWRSPEGEAYVTFPSRAFGAGSDRKYYDYLRAANGDSGPARRLKEWIVNAWRETRREV